MDSPHINAATERTSIKLNRIRLDGVDLMQCPTFRNTPPREHPNRKFFKPGQGADVYQTVARDYVKGRDRVEKEVPVRSQGNHQ